MVTIKLKKPPAAKSAALAERRPPVRGAGTVARARPTLAEAQAERVEREAQARAKARPAAPGRGDPRRGEPRSADPRRSDPRLAGPRRSEPLRGDARTADPRRGDSRQGDPRRSDPRQSDPRRAEPRHGEYRPADPRQGDPWRSDPRQPDPRRPDPRRPDPRRPEPWRGEARHPDPRQGDARRPPPNRFDEQRPDPRRAGPRQPDLREPDPRRPEPWRGDARQPDPRQGDPRRPPPNRFDEQRPEPRHADPRRGSEAPRFEPARSHAGRGAPPHREPGRHGPSQPDPRAGGPAGPKRRPFDRGPGPSAPPRARSPDDDDDDDFAAPPEHAPGSVRLSKRMSELGIASRREADEWIAKGWVRVDDQIVAELGSRVLPEQRVTVDAKARFQQAQRVTVLVNKPVGYVSGQAEDGYEPAVVLVAPQNQWREDRSGTRFLREHLKSLVPAGRLDIDSVGLLVLTQDGRVAKQLIGEDSEIEKEYLVRVAPAAGDATALSEEGLALLRHGLELDGEALLPATVEWVNADQLRFVLKQGKKRQIRRMCEAVGLQVLGLKRVRIGEVMLGDLPAGQWRYLRRDEAFG